MDFVIDLLQSHQKDIDRGVKSENLMQKDMQMATRELAKVTQLKKSDQNLKAKPKKINYED